MICLDTSIVYHFLFEIELTSEFIVIEYDYATGDLVFYD